MSTYHHLGTILLRCKNLTSMRTLFKTHTARRTQNRSHVTLYVTTTQLQHIIYYIRTDSSLKYVPFSTVLAFLYAIMILIDTEHSTFFLKKLISCVDSNLLFHCKKFSIKSEQNVHIFIAESRKGVPFQNIKMNNKIPSTFNKCTTKYLLPKQTS